MTDAAHADDVEEPEGPLRCTFTFQLPFPLGLVSRESFGIAIGSAWVDPASVDTFGPAPIVEFRFASRPTSGLEMFPENLSSVLIEHFGETAGLDDDLPRLATDSSYEQWVTASTAGAYTLDDDSEDLGYAFHRCIEALNVFLRAHLLAFSRMEVHPVSTQELGRLVVYGAFDRHGEWHHIRDLMMHPESWPVFPREVDPIGERLNAGVQRMAFGHPFVTTKLWYFRARRAQGRGDRANVIISLQTAMESLLFDTWRMILIDLGHAALEVESELSKEVPFKTLLTSVLPTLLGGTWDTTLRGSAVNQYWTDLYQQRNRVVHGGLEPGTAECNAGFDAYLKMRIHVNDRVWDSRRKFPRTLLTRIGIPSELGYPEERWTQELQQGIATEPPPFWAPYDVAGRARPVRKESGSGMHWNPSAEGSWLGAKSHEAADRLFNWALSQHPDDLILVRDHARFLAHELGDHDRAEAQYRFLVSECSDDLAMNEEAACYFAERLQDD